MRYVNIRTFLAAIIAAVIILIKPSIARTTGHVIFEILVLPIRSLNNIKHMLPGKGGNHREYAELKKRNTLLSLELSRLTSISGENDRLRELLGMKKRLPYRTIAAEVIGRIPSAWASAVLIDKGKKSGLRKRMPVCAASGLVGTIVETGEFSSKVMLITDPNSRVAVTVKPSGEGGILAGVQNANPRVIYLGMDTAAEPGDEIISSGLGGSYPEGLTIGTIHSVRTEEMGLYKYAVVIPSRNLAALEEVLCIE